MSKREISRQEYESFVSPNTLGRCEDLTGRVFNRLKVLKYAGRTNCGKTGWFCECSCGNPNIIGPLEGNHLKAGHTQSCGCYSRERTSELCKKYNTIEYLNKKVIKVYTSTGYFICDSEDWDKYKCYKIMWRLMRDPTYDSNGFYVRGQPSGIGLKYNSEDRLVISFHRFIMEAKEGEEVDHKNGCTLDCRRLNLRRCTRKENSKNLKLDKRNTSGCSGVDYVKKLNKWRARIQKDKKELCLGFFDNKEDAIKARKEAEEQIYGSFSAKNSRGIENENIPKTIDEIIKEIKVYES